MTAIYNKRVGNLEVSFYPESQSATITQHCNAHVKQEMNMLSLTDIQDLEYIVQCIKKASCDV